jgi:hypothetical protein
MESEIALLVIDRLEASRNHGQLCSMGIGRKEIQVAVGPVGRIRVGHRRLGFPEQQQIPVVGDTDALQRLGSGQRDRRGHPLLGQKPRARDRFCARYLWAAKAAARIARIRAASAPDR